MEERGADVNWAGPASNLAQLLGGDQREPVGPPATCGTEGREQLIIAQCGGAATTKEACSQPQGVPWWQGKLLSNESV